MGSSYNLLGNSAFSFGLSEEETGALEKLAAISDEIANIDEEGVLLDDEEDDLEGEGLLADDAEDEAVACHRSTEQKLGMPQEDIVYIPSPRVGNATQEIMYFPPNMSQSTTGTAAATATVDHQNKPKMTANGGETSSSSSGQQLQSVAPRPALPRPVGFYNKANNNNSSSDGNIAPLLQKPPALMTRRNTCGTLFVGSTMAAPDKDATIKVRSKKALHAKYELWREST